MDIRVLGPVELIVDGRPVDLGPRRQRFVFGVLALDVDRLVPTERLVELAWPGGAPRTAVHAIRVLISRLRGVLTAAEAAFAATAAHGVGARQAVEILTRGTGYLLRADPSRIDAARFLTLLDTAHSTPDAERRFAILTEALALWSGPVLSGAAPPETRERLSRGLDEARLSANRDLVDARLALGQHAQLVPDLERLAAEHPFDERLHRQLILALYRGGRQADALVVCRRLRAVLDAELGLEPSQPVRDLERAVLRQDPTLDLETAAVAIGAGPYPPPVPAQLPPALASFTGRADALARLDAVLAADPDGLPTAAVAVVSGTAGVGKTALAVRWAHRAASRFPDGQLYVNLRGFDPSARSMDPGEAVRGFLDALGAPPKRVPAGLDAQTAMYRSLLAGKRVLVVVDNARDAAQVRPLLPGAPGCLTVVTSRNQLMPLVAGDGAVPVTLDLLPPGEARDLLRVRLGAARVAAEPAAIREILQRCARLPLALAIVAGRAAAHPAFALTDLAAELRDAAGGLDAFGAGDPVCDVRAALSWSYRGLSEPAAELFRLLGRHAGPDVGVGAAASLVGLPAREVRPVVEELTGDHLLAEPAPGRFTMHDLLSAFAGELPEPAGSAAARHRLLDHYAHSAHAALRAIDPMRMFIDIPAPAPGVTVEVFADRPRALAWFDTERAALLGALEGASALRLDTSAWQLSWALTEVLERRGHWQDLVAVQRAAEDAASRLGDRERAHVHRRLALTRARERRFADAHDHLRTALALAESAGDSVGLAGTLLTLAEVHARQDDFGAAWRHSVRALEVFRTTTYTRGIGFGLNSVGWFHAKLGEPHATIDFCRMALDVLRDDRFGQAATWDSLGYAYHLLDQHDRAVDCYRRAIGLFRDLGDRYEEATSLTDLGEVHVVRDPAAARAAWVRALSILDQQGDPDADALRDRLAREPTMTRL